MLVGQSNEAYARSGEYLRLKLQRFIVEEDGVLLLCSDGLSALVDDLWNKLEELGFTQEVAVHHWAVKEAVFPFDRFSNVDTLLG